MKQRILMGGVLILCHLNISLDDAEEKEDENFELDDEDRAAIVSSVQQHGGLESAHISLTTIEKYNSRIRDVLGAVKDAIAHCAEAV